MLEFFVFVHSNKACRVQTLHFVRGVTFLFILVWTSVPYFFITFVSFYFWVCLLVRFNPLSLRPIVYLLVHVSSIYFESFILSSFFFAFRFCLGLISSHPQPTHFQKLFKPPNQPKTFSLSPNPNPLIKPALIQPQLNTFTQSFHSIQS